LVEELGENAQQGGVGYYTITVGEDTYNALSMLRAWFAREGSTSK
jgi:hypothetical protein